MKDKLTRQETQAKIKKVQENLRNGHTIKYSCELANLNRTIYWRKIQSDSEIRTEHYEIIDSRSSVVEDALFKSAVEGNTVAQIFWLKNRLPQRWKDVREHTVDAELTVKDNRKILSDACAILGIETVANKN